MSTTIKKAYQALISFMEANKDKKVSTILDDVKAMCSAKQGGGGGARSFFKVGEEVVAARCGFYEKWFDPKVVEFGNKAGTASGLNSMCKAGVNEWTARNNAVKKARDEGFAEFTEGKITGDELQARLKAAEDARDAAKTLPEGMVGYDTMEELLTVLGVELPAAPSDAE
jgi:hypothetical protein